MEKLLQRKNVLVVCMETTPASSDSNARNYSGGLGALFGDFVRTLDRMNANFLAVTPIYKNGYVQQNVSEYDVTDTFPEQNFYEDYDDTGIILNIPLLHRTVKVKVWQNRIIKHAIGLDSFLPENGELAYITNNLYGENGIGQYDGEAQRLMQEVIVGAGSILAARALGFNFNILHLNEGHGVPAALYLISELKAKGYTFADALKEVRKMTVFTTHTPIGAGNKSRPIQTMLDLGANFGLSYDELRTIGGDITGTMFGSTTAALQLSKIANAVALRHQSTSRELWKDVKDSCHIHYIDNGIDIEYWQSPRIREAYKNFEDGKLLAAHQKEKEILIEEVKNRNGVELRANSPIIGFARRFIEYKRADLIFQDIPRFERLIHDYDFQIIFSGKTHPKDLSSKGILKNIYNMTLKYPKNVVFLQNYDVRIAGLMTKGCDIWLGNPEIPYEACSTSGMKAAANGVINVSTDDGWWFKSAHYSVNGWTIGETSSHNKYTDAQYLYKVFEEAVLPTFLRKHLWEERMLAAIYTAEQDCSTEKMVNDYYILLYNPSYLY